MGIEFIDNGTAPVLYADGLYDAEVIGLNCWFLLFELKKTAGGVLFKEASFYCRMPIEAVGPGIALTIRKAGAAIVIPAASGAMRELTRTWLH